jgi:hypothetical protein
VHRGGLIREWQPLVNLSLPSRPRMPAITSIARPGAFGWAM